MKTMIEYRLDLCGDCDYKFKNRQLYKPDGSLNLCPVCLGKMKAEALFVPISSELD